MVIGDWVLDREAGQIQVFINANIPGVERYITPGTAGSDRHGGNHATYKFKGQMYESVRNLVRAILHDMDPDTVELFEDDTVLGAISHI